MKVAAALKLATNVEVSADEGANEMNFMLMNDAKL